MLLAAAGHDASAVFRDVGHSPNAMRQLGRLIVAPRTALVPPEEEDAAAAGFSPRRRSEASASGGGDGRAAAPTTARRALQAVLTSVRSESGRSRLRDVVRMGVNALVADLTEGRPDCRRLAPAVWRLGLQELERGIDVGPPKGAAAA